MLVADSDDVVDSVANDDAVDAVSDENVVDDDAHTLLKPISRRHPSAL